MEEKQTRYIDGLKSGSEKIFGELFNEYYEPLCRACLRYVPDRHEAEEIVQDLFVHLWERRGELAIGKSVAAYLFKSVVNRALNYKTHQQLKRTHLDHVKSKANDINRDPGFLEEEELYARYQTILAHMPEKRRKVFLMSRKHGLKYAEIAERMSISVKTVEVHLSKALQDLRRKLREYLPLLLVLASEASTNF